MPVHALREIVILKKLDHPNIIKLKGKDRNEQFYYLFLEHCNGGDLKKYIKHNGFLQEN